MTLIIGDIHGCYDELQALLDKAGICEDDEVISLGDVVDRGPASPRTLAFLRERPRTQVLMGNHERKHVRHAQGKVEFSYAQHITRAQFEEMEQDYTSALEFMGTLPLYLELEHANLVHGYVEPGVDLADQRSTVLTGTMSGDSYLRKKLARPWYELYRGEKPVIVGHRNYNRNDEPFIFRDLVYGLDTSVYMGGALTGLILPEFRIVSVSARANHWQIVHRQYRHLAMPQKKAPEIAPEHWAMDKLSDWLDCGKASAADQARLGQMLADSMRILPDLQCSLEQLYEGVLDQGRRTEANFDDLSARDQGRIFDGVARKYPPIVRQLLHRLRTGDNAEAVITEQLKSPAQIIAAWKALSEGECRPSAKR